MPRHFPASAAALCDNEQLRTETVSIFANRNGQVLAMKGDFSRIRFNPAKQYTAVLEQQGRVSLDADSNEQLLIDEYLRRNETVDVIGAYGAPGARCRLRDLHSRE